MVVDLSRLELITRGNKNLKEELLRLFLKTANFCVESLESVTTIDNFESIIHQLKGAAGNMGFGELCELCAEAENNGEWFARRKEFTQKIKSFVSMVEEKISQIK